MLLSLRGLHLRRPDVGDSLVRWAHILNAKAVTGQYYFETSGVQFGKAIGKLKLLTIDCKRTERALSGRQVCGEMLPVDREEPADSRLLKHDVAGSAVRAAMMDNTTLDVTENE